MISFRIKICGVTRSQDASAARRLGADAIGLNFYPASKRYVPPEQVASWPDDSSQRLTRVGVFVNAQPDEIGTILGLARLDAVQLHGDEEPSPEWFELPGRPDVIKALRVPADHSGDGSLQQLQAEIGHWEHAGAAGILLDTAHPGAYGGTGLAFPWTIVPQLATSIPLLLAGGLNAETVGDAIRQARPFAVDVASGVEAQPGIKDEAKMAAFISAARDAFPEQRPESGLAT